MAIRTTLPPSVASCTDAGGWLTWARLLVIHQDGKAETAKDYRGSSDFKAAMDQGYHVASFGVDGKLDKLVLRPFKSRIGCATEISYEYAGGRLMRGDVADARLTVNEQLTSILLLNPGIFGTRFEGLAGERGVSRTQARSFLQDGVKAGFIDQQTGAKNQEKCMPSRVRRLGMISEVSFSPFTPPGAARGCAHYSGPRNWRTTEMRQFAEFAKSLRRTGELNRIRGIRRLPRLRRQGFQFATNLAEAFFGRGMFGGNFRAINRVKGSKRPCRTASTSTG